jgi:hypothetical protein
MPAHLDISSGKERRPVDTIQNSIYIIQIFLAVECLERPSIQKASSLFVPFNTQDAMQRGGRAHLRRKLCHGYLLIAVRPSVSGYARFIMSMTVWKRYMCDASGDKVRAHEHAPIMKNFLVPDAPRRMAMRMHSFAADTVGQPLVVCNPYATMGEILQEFIRRHQIPRGQHRQNSVVMISPVSLLEAVRSRKIRRL